MPESPGAFTRCMPAPSTSGAGSTVPDLEDARAELCRRGTSSSDAGGDWPIVIRWGGGSGLPTDGSAPGSHESG